MIKEYYASYYWLGFIGKLLLFGIGIYILLTDIESLYFLLGVMGVGILFSLIALLKIKD